MGGTYSTTEPVGRPPRSDGPSLGPRTITVGAARLAVAGSPLPGSSGEAVLCELKAAGTSGRAAAGDAGEDGGGAADRTAGALPPPVAAAAEGGAAAGWAPARPGGRAAEPPDRSGRVRARVGLLSPVAAPPRGTAPHEEAHRHLGQPASRVLQQRSAPRRRGVDADRCWMDWRVVEWAGGRDA